MFMKREKKISLPKFVLEFKPVDNKKYIYLLYCYDFCTILKQNNDNQRKYRWKLPNNLLSILISHFFFSPVQCLCLFFQMMQHCFTHFIIHYKMNFITITFTILRFIHNTIIRMDPKKTITLLRALILTLNFMIHMKW